MLSQQEADCHVQVEAVTRKLLNWISHTGTTPGKRRDRLLLLYDYLDQLELSDEVEEVKYKGATSSLVLAATGTPRSTERNRYVIFLSGGSWLLALLFSVKAEPFGFASFPGLDRGRLAPFFASLPDLLGKKCVLFPS